MLYVSPVKMAEAAAAPAKKAAPKAKKAAKPAPTHPKWADMIAAAITSLKNRKGSSAIAIKKYIAETYKIDEKTFLFFNDKMTMY